MNRTIPTLAAATIAATALTGSASAGPNTLDAFMAEYDCHHMTAHNWSSGGDLLLRPGGVKTTLFVIPGERTVMVRKGTSKAGVAAASAYGSIRMVCGVLVPWAEKPELGS